MCSIRENPLFYVIRGFSPRVRRGGHMQETRVLAFRRFAVI
jgi:hypothetical protein